mmetsp:Transcript_71042/g.117643  ORF Transcript_71042/g.117643 Transcript_71042/m.117643 type:complete len:175 (+) Transcript_71042:41-565(+)
MTTSQKPGQQTLSSKGWPFGSASQRFSSAPARTVPAWKEEAYERTQRELQDILSASYSGKNGATSWANSKLGRPKGASACERHARWQLLARTGLDDRTPVRPAGHRPTTGAPPVTGPLWSCPAPPMHCSPSSRSSHLALSELAPIRVWQPTKARPYGPPNLCGGLDGQGVNWCW